MLCNALKRDPTLYWSGAYPGEKGEDTQLFKMTKRFDGEEGNYNEELIEEANALFRESGEFENYTLLSQPVRVWPKKVVVVDSSAFNLPLSPETCRIIRCVLEETGHGEVEVVKVDTKEELMKAVSSHTSETLLLSQCVSSKVYNTEVCEDLEKKGVVCIPGRVTAPGGLFTHKEETYRLLKEKEKKSGKKKMVAEYVEINPHTENLSTREVAERILFTVVNLSKKSGKSLYFVKPTKGGSGLGGFRIEVRPEGFLIPDLSKVTGLEKEDVEPVWISFDPDNRAQMKELAYTFRLFEKDEYVAKSYLRPGLSAIKEMYKTDDDVEAVAEHVRRTQKMRSSLESSAVFSKEKAVAVITDAFEVFEEKFGIRYHPLVCEHIPFGTWGFRVHMRMTSRGPEVETIYARIFQMALTPNGIGYVGSDNISNSQTGRLEIIRCGPLNPIQVEAVGGKEALMECLIVAARGFSTLIDQERSSRRAFIPFRAELDMAPTVGIICEGNADPGRGLSIASRWERFRRNTEEWFMDALGRYSQVKIGGEG